jgi:hypothetical protein
MIRKIISGGQTGADQAALDAAIKLGIPHGGWIPKGRLTENGALNAKYNLKEMPSSSYSERTEQNVIESDGTVIISHGNLTEGSDFTRKMAIKHDRPWLHVDLNKISAFKAAIQINSWLADNKIETLNVAGPRASKNKRIYQDVLSLLESVYYLTLMKNNKPKSRYLHEPNSNTFKTPPRTVEAAVGKLISEMSLKDKAIIANMNEAELINLNASLDKYILDKFDLWSDNEELKESCSAVSEYPIHDEDDVVTIIIKQLWQKLRHTHKLKIVK